MSDLDASRTALARVVKRVFPRAVEGDLWRGIRGWRAPRPKAAAVHAQTGTYDPAFTVIGFAPRKTGLTVYFLDPGDYYVLDAHAKDLATDGLTTGRGCIYWTRKGVLPTAAIERLLRSVKARDAKRTPTAAHAPPTKAAAERKRAASATPKPRAVADAPRRKGNSSIKPMKAYPTFDAYEADQPARNQAIIRVLRKLVKRVAPRLRESVKWGNGCWVTDDANVAYVYSADDHVQFGFFNGAALKDPRKLLNGSGKFVRHVKLREAAGAEDAALKALLRQAVAQA